MTPSPDIQYRALLQAVEEVTRSCAMDEIPTTKNRILARAAEIAATLPQAVSQQAVQVTDGDSIEKLLADIPTLIETAAEYGTGGGIAASIQRRILALVGDKHETDR
jgi:hypothetical protein